MCNKSETISKIAAALVKFSDEVRPIEKDGTNPHFRSAYTTLDHMIDSTKPILTKYGLTVMQFPGGDGHKITVRTMIIHESGEWIETEPLTLQAAKTDPQGAGSAITYARRYSYAAALSLSLGDDDDGNNSSLPPQGQQSRSNQQPTQQQGQYSTGHTGQSQDRVATENQVKLLRAKMRSAGFETIAPINSFLAMNLESITELPMSKVNDVIKFLDEQRLPA
ncbi:ERF family protein [Paenibacillus sp. CAU 1782]